MASLILLPFVLPPKPQTKQKQWEGSLRNADHTVSFLWYQEEQGKGREWNREQSRHWVEWPTKAWIPDFQFADGDLKKKKKATLKPKLVVLQISYQFQFHTAGLEVCQNSLGKEIQLSIGSLLPELRDLTANSFPSFPTHSDDHCLFIDAGF